jgi:hypothetical protein
MAKVYELAVSPLLRVLPFVAIGVAAVGLVVGVVLGGPKGPPPAILLLLIPFIGVQAWVFMRQVYRVVVHEDGAMEWISLGGTVRVRPENVLKIGPERSGSIGFFVLTHTEGKVRFVNQITGFHEIVALIKSRNPRVELRGC